MAPDSMTIYQMELPFNTTISKNLLMAAKWRHDASSRVRGQLVHEAPLGGGGVRGARRGRLHHRVGVHGGQETRSTKFIYRDRLWQGADMVGLGVASFGYVNGVHMQNHDTNEA